MLPEFEIRELIGRFKRDADFDMGDDSMIAAIAMEALLENNSELTKQRDELLEALKGMRDLHESNTDGNLRRLVLDAIGNAEK